jgi:hypothetical protein
MAKRREVLTESTHGPDGQFRARGAAPAEEWYADEHAWFLEDLRGTDPPRRVDGAPLEDPPATAAEVVELAASGPRGRGGQTGGQR